MNFRARYSLSVIFALSIAAPALASPVFDAVEKKRYSDAIAASTQDDTLFAYARWAALSEPGGHIYLSFSEAVRFLREHREWPLENRVRLSVEAAQLRDGGSGDDAQWMCNELKPISGRGMIACANLLPREDARVATLVRQGWMQGDFEAGEEQAIRSRYRHLLEANDHAARTERLLFEGKTTAAHRMLPLLSSRSRSIADVRIALITGNRAADRKLAALPDSARQSVGIIFDRVRYRYRKRLHASAMELLAQAPANPPHANAWWPMRQFYAREAIQSGQYRTALSIVRAPGDLDVEYKAEALWLSGWIRYEFLNDAKGAFSDFSKLYDIVSTPVSKSRGAYWAGRAAERAGTGDASVWFEKAASYPTVFYGQLAFARLNKGEPLDLPSDIRGNPPSGKMTQIASRLDARGDAGRARLFWEAAALSLSDENAIAGLAELANKVHRGNAVRTAKAAIRKNIVLIKQGWPLTTLPKQNPIENALSLAIARQESEFDPRAVSSANARGLMQVLPSTAAHTIRAFGLPYNSSDLFNPAANLHIGSSYLAELIGNRGGSYVAAIAGYNAGPGAVSRWIAANGRPGGSIDASLRWIESIPYGETRNYVQRVLENLQVYRARLNPDTPLGIEKDLLR